MCAIVAKARATVVGVGSLVLNVTRPMVMTRVMASRGIERRSPGTEPQGACAIGLERSCGSMSVFCLSVQQQPRVCC